MQITPLHTSIEKLIELKKGIVVMENPNGFPVTDVNLYFIAPNGSVVWKAEKPSPHVLFTKVKLNENFSISTFTSGGQFCDLDIETGKITGTSNFK